MALDAEEGWSDDDLLALYASGDRDAARRLTLRFTPVALRVAQRMLADAAEAEDVAQEAMLRLWRMAPGWQPGEAKVATWLYRVVANLCTDRLRRRRTVPLEAAPEPEDGDPGAETQSRQHITGVVRTDRDPRHTDHPGEQCQPDARRDHQRQAATHRAQQVGPRGCGEHEALARVFPRAGYPRSCD